MSAERIYSLAHLTALDHSPPDLVRLAARTGYSHVGLRMLPASPGGVAYRLAEDAPMIDDTLAAMQDTGVGVLDLEVVRIGEGFDAAALEPFFAAGQRLGAKHVLIAGDDPDEARFAASFALLCETARPYGLTCDLEFMPWTEVPDARTALRIVTSADQPNGGVLVDGIHFGRSASTLADIAAIPRRFLNYTQICDAVAGTRFSTEQLLHTARTERLLPGDGTIDLKGLFATLPADLPVSAEMVNDAGRADRGMDGWAALVLERSRALVEASRS